jgi:hypothetical protein
MYYSVYTNQYEPTTPDAHKVTRDKLRQEHAWTGMWDDAKARKTSRLAKKARGAPISAGGSPCDDYSSDDMDGGDNKTPTPPVSESGEGEYRYRDEQNYDGDGR